MENTLTQWLETYFDEVSPREFYRGIFPPGELEAKGEYITGKYTGIIVSITDKRKEDGRRKVCRYSLTDDLDAVEAAAASSDFCLCSPSLMRENRGQRNTPGCCMLLRWMSIR